MTLSADANLGLGELEESRRYVEAANRICQETQNVAVYQYVLNTLARLELAVGNLDEAEEAAQQSVTITAELAPQVQSVCHVSLARVLMAAGDHDQACEVLERVIGTGKAVKLQWALAVAFQLRSELLILSGEYATAEAMARESLAICQQERCLGVALDCLQTLAEIRAALESFVEAARLLGASEALRETTGYVRFPAQRARATHLTQELKSELGGSFDAAWNEGSRLDLDGTAEYILRGR